VTIGVYPKLYIDWDGDGSFETAGDDISVYVMAVQEFDGMADEWTPVADVGQVWLTLRNDDKRFTPDYADGPYYGKFLPNLPAKLAFTDGVDEWDILTGTVRRWWPASGQVDGTFTCEMLIEDRLATLNGTGVTLPNRENKTADVLIKQILAEAFGTGLAEGTLTIAYSASSGTVTVGDEVYTVAGSPSVSGAILAGTASEVADHLAAAINGDLGSGTLYDSDLSRHGDVAVRVEHGAEYEASNQNVSEGIDGSGATYTKRAQIFTLTEKVTFDRVAIYFLANAGSPPGTSTFRIETLDGDDFPSGTLADDDATGTIVEATIAAGWNLVTLAGEITLEAGRYALVNTTTSAYDGVNYAQWGEALPGTYSGGRFVQYNSGAAQWEEAYVNVGGSDLIFAIPSRVVLYANARGTWGNDLALATTITGAAVSGAALSGGADAADTAIDTGIETLEIAGDQWSEGRTTGLKAIRDVVESEPVALFYADGEGNLTYKNRTWLFRQPAAAISLTVDGKMNSLKLSLDIEDIYNYIIVSHTPRGESDAGVVVAQVRNRIEVPGRSGVVDWTRHRQNVTYRLGSNSGQQPVEVTVPLLEAETGHVVGAKDLIAPVAGTDYDVYDDWDFDYTLKGRVSVGLAVSGGEIRATFANTALGRLYVDNFQVRGTALIAYDPQDIIRQDDTSIAAYGKRRKRLRLPLPVSVVFAESVASYFRNRYKDPKTRLKSIRVRNQAVIGSTNVFSLSIGKTLSISEDQTAQSNVKALVIGRSFSWSPRRFDLTLRLRPLGDKTYWILGDSTYSVLGSTTRLAI
jgi:hypothetical protein